MYFDTIQPLYSFEDKKDDIKENQQYKHFYLVQIYN